MYERRKSVRLCTAAKIIEGEDLAEPELRISDKIQSLCRNKIKEGYERIIAKIIVHFSHFFMGRKSDMTMNENQI